jgi:thiosulfate/3-mercaptopyruvate sulfurtransferase
MFVPALGRESVLVTADHLARALDGPQQPVLLDVRWTLGGPPGHDEYLTGHIPGAVFVDLDRELALPPEDRRPQDGRHPLPRVEALQADMRRWGISDATAVVAYDDSGNTAAARAWWLLRWAGLEDVRLLDGGLSAWRAAGGAVATNDVVAAPGSVRVRPGCLPTVGVEALEAWTGTLLDARAAERYRGETEPVDPKAGHIPGATSAPTTDNLAADGTFLPTEDLVARFRGLDGPVAAYCGSGVTAAHQIAALAIAGIDATLYPGSWSQWSNLDLPVETGPVHSLSGE